MVVFCFHPIIKIFYAAHRCGPVYIKKVVLQQKSIKHIDQPFWALLWLELLRKKFSIWGIGYLLRYCKKAFQMWPDNSYPFILYWITRVVTVCHFVRKQPLTHFVFILYSLQRTNIFIRREREKEKRNADIFIHIL